MAIENKIILVTGGAIGIGFACAAELLRNGAAHVAILDLANANGEEAASKLNAEFGKGKAIFVVCDVTKPEELEAGFAKTVQEFGGLDIIINNAGTLDGEHWELMIDINYNALVRGTLLGLEYMGKNKGHVGGTIVNVSSVSGIYPMSLFPIYSGTKHAVIGFTRSLAQPYHYDKTGVRLLMLCPSFTETKLLNDGLDQAKEITGKDFVDNLMKTHIQQTPESVAQGLMHVLKVGENGSAWIVEHEKLIFEVKLPDFLVNNV